MQLAVKVGLIQANCFPRQYLTLHKQPRSPQQAGVLNEQMWLQLADSLLK